jgi:hypothetical protein
MGAALVLALEPRIFFPLQGRPSIELNRRLPEIGAMFCPAVYSSITFPHAQEPNHAFTTFPGAACCEGLQLYSAPIRMSGGR